MASCPSCQAVDTVVYSANVIGAVCVRCGYVVEGSNSHTLSDRVNSNLLQAERELGHVDGFIQVNNEGEFDMAGLRGDIEDETEGGRRMLAGGGFTFLEGSTARMGRTEVRKMTAKEEYHERKHIENEKYIKSVLNYYSLAALQGRVGHLLADTKLRRKVKWGLSARILSTACIYVAAKERSHSMTIVSLAYITDIDPQVLVRAQNSIKSSLKIKTFDMDPLLFLERQIVHFQNLLASSSKPPLTGGKKPNWSPANLEWLRSLSLSAVRDLATGLIAFSNDISLIVGRTPEPVACAVVIIAMEGVARRPGPASHEIMSELCALMNVKSFTVAERMRELNKVLADYASRIPWFGEASKGKSKKELVGLTEDIVKFRKGLDLKRRQGVEVEDEKLILVEEEVTGEEMESDEEDEGYGEMFPDPLQRAKSAPRVGLTTASSVTSTGRGTASTSASPAPTPATSTGRPALITAASRAKSLASAKSKASSTIDRSSSTPAASTPVPVKTTSARLLEILIADKVKPPLRPKEYMRKDRPGPERRQKTIEHAATSLLIPFSGTPVGIRNASPVASTSGSISPSTPTIGSSTFPLLLGKKPRLSAYNAHSQEAVLFRERLLAGHDVGDIYKTNIIRQGPAPSRLDKLLWTKRVDSIEDDELFEEGELQSFIRTEGEIELLERTGKFRGIEGTLIDAGNTEERREREERRSRGRKRDADGNLVPLEKRRRKTKVDAAMNAKIKLASLDDEAQLAMMAENLYENLLTNQIKDAKAGPDEEGNHSEEMDSEEEEGEDGEDGEDSATYCERFAKYNE